MVHSPILICGLAGVLVTMTASLAAAQWSVTGCAELAPFGVSSGAGNTTSKSTRTVIVAGVADFSLGTPCTIRGSFTLRLDMGSIAAAALAAGRSSARATVQSIAMEPLPAAATFPTIAVILSNASAPLAVRQLPLQLTVADVAWALGDASNNVTAAWYGVTLTGGNLLAPASTLLFRGLTMRFRSLSNTHVSTSLPATSNALTISLVALTDITMMLSAGSSLQLVGNTIVLDALTGSGNLALFAAWFAGLWLNRASVEVRDCALVLKGAALATTPTPVTRKIALHVFHLAIFLNIRNTSTTRVANSSATISDGIDVSGRGIFTAGVLSTREPYYNGGASTNDAGPALSDNSTLVVEDCRAVLRDAAFDTYYPFVVMVLWTLAEENSTVVFRRNTVETVRVRGRHTYQFIVEAGRYLILRGGSAVVFEDSSLLHQGSAVVDGGFLFGFWGRNVAVLEVGSRLGFRNVSVTTMNWALPSGSSYPGLFTVAAANLGTISISASALLSMADCAVTVQNYDEAEAAISPAPLYAIGLYLEASTYSASQHAVTTGGRLALSGIAVTVSVAASTRAFSSLVLRVESLGGLVVTANGTLSVEDSRAVVSHVASVSFTDIATIAAIVGDKQPWNITVLNGSTLAVRRCSVTALNATVSGALNAYHLGASALRVDQRSAVVVEDGRLEVRTAVFGAPPAKGLDGGVVAMAYVKSTATVSNGSAVRVTGTRAALREAQCRGNPYYALLVLRVEAAVTMTGGASAVLEDNCPLVAAVTTPTWSIGPQRPAAYQSGITPNVSVCSGCRLSMGRMCLTRTVTRTLPEQPSTPTTTTTAAPTSSTTTVPPTTTPHPTSTAPPTSTPVPPASSSAGGTSAPSSTSTSPGQTTATNPTISPRSNSTTTGATAGGPAAVAEEGGGLSTVVIVAIAVGSTALLALCLAAVFCVCRRKRRGGPIFTNRINFSDFARATPAPANSHLIDDDDDDDQISMVEL